ncbi:MAG: hypothetical protein Q9188_004736 [Gyalolechia gomerana]
MSFQGIQHHFTFVTRILNFLFVPIGKRAVIHQTTSISAELPNKSKSGSAHLTIRLIAFPEYKSGTLRLQTCCKRLWKNSNKTRQDEQSQAENRDGCDEVSSRLGQSRFDNVLMVLRMLMSDYEVTLVNDNSKAAAGIVYSTHMGDLTKEQSPFEGGLWKIHVELPDQYPYKSPSIGFVNRIFHPNIDELYGTLRPRIWPRVLTDEDLDVINQTWSPMFDMINIFEVFLPQLLRYPNPTDPLNGEAAALLMRDPKTYDVKVKVSEYVNRYASKEAADEAGDDSDEDDGMSSVGDFESGDEEPAGQMEV